MDEGRECDERTTNAKGMKKRKAKTGGVPRLSGRAVDGNEYQIPINLTEGWTWLDDGTEERRTAAAKACLTLRNPSRSTPASDLYSDGLKSCTVGKKAEIFHHYSLNLYT